MPTVILVSADDDWHAPLAAMLREGSVTVSIAPDAFDVLPLLEQAPGSPVVVGPDLDAAAARILLAGLSRRMDAPTVLLCGKAREGLDDEATVRDAGFAGLVTKPWKFARLIERVRELVSPPHASPEPGTQTPESSCTAPKAEAPPPSSAMAAGPEVEPAATKPQSPAPPSADTASALTPAGEHPPEAAPTASWSGSWFEEPLSTPSTAQAAAPDRQTVERLLRLARHEDYFMLLDVGRAAGEETVREAARRIRDALLPQRFDPRLLDRYLTELVEIRAAVADAEAILTSEDARRMYLQGLRSP